MTPEALSQNFPALDLHPERVLFRIHRAANDPVYFSNSGLGRFDLLGIAGSGTCYLSPSPIGAYLETFGRIGTIAWSDVEQRRLSELTLARALRLGDLTNRTILGRYGITGDLSVGADYSPSQDLARQLYDLGFDGIYYTIRHDPAFIERAVAVFGGSGEQKLFVASTAPIPDAVIGQGARDYALLVLPSPPSS